MSTLSPRPQADSAGRGGAPAASGLMLFAAIMILIAGVFNLFDGVVGFLLSTYYIGHPIGGALWVWALLLLAFGVVEIAAAGAIMAGQAWGRWFGIVVAGLNTLFHLSAIAIYPWWSLIVIAINLLVIFGLTASWRQPKVEA